MKNIIKVLFCIYCLLLIWIILLKASFTFEQITWLFGTRSVNLIPFHYEDVVAFQVEEVVSNLIIFIPFGLYLKMLGVSSKKAILYGFGCSLLFEVCQFVFAIGASDITDLITNTFGAIVGVSSYQFLELCFRDKNKINKIITIFAGIVTISIILLAILLFVANYK